MWDRTGAAHPSADPGLPTGCTLGTGSQLPLGAADKPSRELVSAPDTGEVGSLCWERFLALRFDDSSFLGCFPSAELGVPASV